MFPRSMSFPKNHASLSPPKWCRQPQFLGFGTWTITQIRQKPLEIYQLTDTISVLREADFGAVWVINFYRSQMHGIYHELMTKYTILQNKRMRWCGVPPRPPPPIIFKRQKQIIYRRKGNLSESPNHLKYRKNILISRFYERFSRSSRNLGYFGSSKTFQTLRTQTYHISF